MGLEPELCLCEPRIALPGPNMRRPLIRSLARHSGGRSRCRARRQRARIRAPYCLPLLAHEMGWARGCSLSIEPMKCKAASSRSLSPSDVLDHRASQHDGFFGLKETHSHAARAGARAGAGAGKKRIARREVGAVYLYKVVVYANNGPAARTANNPTTGNNLILRQPSRERPPPGRRDAADNTVAGAQLASLC